MLHRTKFNINDLVIYRGSDDILVGTVACILITTDNNLLSCNNFTSSVALEIDGDVPCRWFPENEVYLLNLDS